MECEVTQMNRSVQGFTLDDYCKRYRLDRSFIENVFGVFQITYMGKPAVAIPYMDEHGDLESLKVRLSDDENHCVTFNPVELAAGVLLQSQVN